MMTIATPPGARSAVTPAERGAIHGRRVVSRDPRGGSIGRVTDKAVCSVFWAWRRSMLEELAMPTENSVGRGCERGPVRARGARAWPPFAAVCFGNLVAFAIAGCAHEPEWRVAAPASTAVRDEPIVGPARPRQCGSPEMLARWRDAADGPQLCALLSRVRGTISTMSSQPRGMIAPTAREELRRIVEKCRSDLRLSSLEVGRYSRATFRVLLNWQGSIALATSDDEPSNDRFLQCATLAMRARASESTAGDLYEFVVPPIPLRWWADPRSPQSSNGLIW